MTDVDGDGTLDVVATDNFLNSLRILPGRGDGTLAPVVEVPLPAQPFAVAVADFNRDRAPDVAVSSPFPGALLVFLQRSADREAPRVSVPETIEADATSDSAR